MNQKTGIQIIAAFLVLTMVLSIFPMFFGSDSSDSRDAPPVTNIRSDYFNVGGKQVLHGFGSIADALKMSPPDVQSAQFADVEYITSSAPQNWNEELTVNLTTVRLLGKNEIDNLYQSRAQPVSTRQMYFAESSDDFLILSTMTPKIITFEPLIQITSNDKQYVLLFRDTGGVNVMGDPTIYAANRENAETVLSIIESFIIPSTAYDTFSPVLNYSDEYSEYQVVNSNVDFADLYYLGLHRNDDGTFTRTTIYQNATNEASAHVRELASSGSERDFVQYEIEEEDNIMKVTVTGEFLSVVNEDIK